MRTDKLSKLSYLLGCLSEECAEVQQAIGKAHRFGILDINPKKTEGKTNWVNIRQELHDVVAVYELLCDEFDRVSTLDRALIEAKKVKLVKWSKVSKELGVLDDSINEQ